MKGLALALVPMLIVAGCGGGGGGGGGGLGGMLPGPGTPTVTTTTLPGGTTGTPYTATIEAAGGTAMGYGWSIVAGGLPGGFTLGASGTPTTTISGTTSATGTFGFTVRVRDSAGGIDDANLSITIVAAPPPALAITTTTAPQAVVGSAYSAAIAATGGTGGYTWSVAAGTPPNGLVLAPNGQPSTTLSGMPSDTGTFTFTVRVTDGAGATDDQDLSIVVNPALILETTVLPSAVMNNAYTAPLVGSGGVAPYAWSVSAGNLPAGLTLGTATTATNTISGSPGAFGTFKLTVSLTDARPVTVSRNLSVAIKSDVTRVYYLGDETTDGTNEIFYAEYDGTTGTITGYQQVSGPFVAGGNASFDFPNLQHSPDGTKLAYIADAETDTKAEIYVVDVSGAVPGPARKANPTIVPAGGDVSLRFAWSPDSSKIAFRVDAEVDEEFDVWVADVSGAGPIVPQKIVIPYTLPRFNDADVQFGTILGDGFDWSYDGQHLVLLVGEPTLDGQDELFVVDVGGTPPFNATKVNGALPYTTTSTNGDVDRYRLSPTHNTVLYRADQDADNVFEIYYATFENGVPSAPVKVNPPMPTNGDVTTNSTPGLGTIEFSPDGKLLQYRADGTTDNTDEIYVARVVNGIPQVPAFQAVPGILSATQDCDGAVFSPDSTRLLIRGNLDPANGTKDELFIVDVSGPSPTAPAKVNTTFTSAVNLAGSDSRSTWFWSPDGRKVLYRANQDTSAVTEVYVVNVATSPFGPAQKANAPLTVGNVLSRPVFSPDSTKLIYRADATTATFDEMFLVKFEPTTGAPLPAERVHPAPVNGGEVFVQSDEPTWDAFSRFIGFRASLDVSTDIELFIFNTVTGTAGVVTQVNRMLPANGDITTHQFHNGDNPRK